MRESFAFTARVLGALFYYAPDSPEAAPLVTALTHNDWQQDWPLDECLLAPIADELRQPADEPLRTAWQRLFLGPWALPAPPWGSVWLDRESVLLGIPPWRCASGCGKTASCLRWRTTSRKITLAPCC